jgi:hypothetical protein
MSGKTALPWATRLWSTGLALLTDWSRFHVLAGLLVTAEAIICAAIILRVPCAFRDYLMLCVDARAMLREPIEKIRLPRRQCSKWRHFATVGCTGANSLASASNPRDASLS